MVWGETGPILGIFENKLKLSYHLLIEQIPILIYFLLLYWLVFRIIPLLYILLQERYNPRIALSSFAMLILIGIGGLMGKTDVFYGETANLVCKDNVIATHERVAEQLKAMIPEGSLLHWNLSSNMLLLILPQMEIFPPQLNTNFNYVQQSTPDESDQIYRFGYWDQYLDENWAREADYLVVPGQTIANWQPRIDSGEFSVVGSTGPYETCRPSDTTITVLKYEGAE